MAEDGRKYDLKIAIPNGIILGLIGVLVLITPMTVEVRGRGLTMDLVAGAVLVVGGAVSLLWGLLRR